ncbi:hypothetical protein ACFC36_19620 [Streptomyces rubiginosohelvolus]|uniref:hypothetical protein n=1 Tax=Streptomyces rubiginosohelvolus TaxID=67362 RepID=UPI0035DC3A97
MDHDVDKLRDVAGVLNEALALLKTEEHRLAEHRAGRERDHDDRAGSPGQTVIGLGEMTRGLREKLDGLALYAGFAALGLEKRAEGERRRLRMEPRCVPSGTNRMARPLGEATVRALQLLRELDTFFAGGFAARIDEALAAPRATYPPADWEAYRRQGRIEATTPGAS